jgi:type I restriction enzyme S subunit
MKSWPTKPLGELLKVQNGFAFKSELFNEDGKGLPIIRIRDLARGFSETFYDGENDPAFEVEKGDFLIGMDGEFRCHRWQSGKALLNQRVCRLQNFSHDLNASYVFYGINEHLRKIEDNTAFVTVKHLSSKQIACIEMPVPPLAEQERIVELLDEADELRKMRAHADHRTAALIPALFHEMFGNPETNPKRWPTKRLGETTSINPKLPREKLPADENEFSFVPMAAVDEVLGVISSSETRQYGEVSKGYTPFKNRDVLFAKITPCMQNGKSAIAENLVGGLGFGSTEFHVLRPTDVVTSEYIFWLIRRSNFRAQAEQHFTGSAGQQRVPTSFLKNYPCPIPPMPLQEEFAQRVKEIRELEASQATSRTRLDALFQSMLHRAFNEEI